MNPLPRWLAIGAASAASSLTLATAQTGPAYETRTTLKPTTAAAHAPVAPPAMLLAGPRPKIMLTGYWPPTNEAVRRFSASPVQNPSGWIGSDWEARGYDVYSYFPEFSPPTCTNCGPGTGDLTVDYQDTSLDFWNLANALQPIAIITFSRATPASTWEVEMNQYNRTTWASDYIAPTQPTPAPPDASVPASFLRLSTLPVQNIINAVNAAALGVPASICFTGDGGGFLSEFIAYHGVWYQSIHRSPSDPARCICAGHVHVGRLVTWPVATSGVEITLREVIAHVDAVRAATVCQQDVGFGGPGASQLVACGTQLVAGGSADLRLGGGRPSAPAVLLLADQSNPTPFAGGNLVPWPPDATAPVTLDAAGDFLLTVVAGAPRPAPLVYLQFVYIDLALPQSFGFSNAVAMSFP